MSKTDNNDKPGRPFMVVGLAVLLLGALSFVPWERITGGHIKNFNLFSDLVGLDIDSSAEKESTATVEVDPALLEFAQKDDPATADTVGEATVDVEAPDFTPEALGETVKMEDYSPSGNGLARFRSALERSAGRTVRVAVIGDSYIEGDIFTQDVRRLLQDEYGGSGTGYMGMHSEFPGFRRSVRQSDSGWTERDMRHHSRDSLRTLQAEYYIGNAGSRSTYKGTKSLRHLDSWNHARVMFIAPADGTVTVNTGGEDMEYPVQASKAVQCIEVREPMTSFTVKNGVAGNRYLGVWLDSDNGVSVDCMSLRGNSGVTHSKLNVQLARDMARFVDYDLIVVEFGINALTAEQTDYTAFSRAMEQVVARLRQCYPNADIIMMGIGDRGQKKGGNVHSIATAPYMVAAQRRAARRAGVVFWDTRAAMGGDDAIVKWRADKLVNADYIHLNHKGGGELARRFVTSLKDALND